MSLLSHYPLKERERGIPERFPFLVSQPCTVQQVGLLFFHHEQFTVHHEPAESVKRGKKKGQRGRKRLGERETRAHGRERERDETSSSVTDVVVTGNASSERAGS